MSDETPIFCDESGNTGVDLLNEDQPIFSLASTSIYRKLAAELMAELTQGRPKEAKYSRLKGSVRGQRRLLEFLNSRELEIRNTKVFLTDKKFYLISHLVDKLIEPPLHEAGVDLYDRDAHVGLANVWFFAGHTIFPGGHWARVQKALVHAIRRRTESSFAEFDEVLRRAARQTPAESRQFANGILLACGRLSEFIGVYGDMVVFDPAVDAFTALMQSWMNQESGRLRVTHDESKPLRQSEEFLRFLMTPASVRLAGYGDRKGELPLRISTLTFCGSIGHEQIQVADVLAGAASDWLLAMSGRKASDYHSALVSSDLSRLIVGGMDQKNNQA
jgi:hypothetical protein